MRDCSFSKTGTAYESITTLNDYWNNNNCPLAYELSMNSSSPKTPNDPCVLKFSSQESCKVINNFNFVFETYTSNCKIGDDKNSDVCKEFEIKLRNICVNPSLPGLCEYFLSGKAPQYIEGGVKGLCPSLSDREDFCNKNYTRDEVLKNSMLGSFCGCYITPDPTFSENIKVTPDCLIGGDDCRVCTDKDSDYECVSNPSCDPLCHRASTSQRAYNPTGTIITCPQNICAINDVNINVDNSKVPGGINFNSICGGCDKNNGCLCVISGVNITQTMSTIGVGNLNNLCETSVCIADGEEPKLCGDFNPKNGIIPPYRYSVNIGLISIAIIFILIILFICISVRFNTKSNNKSNTKSNK
jgi:hypothetical protein